MFKCKNSSGEGYQATVDPPPTQLLMSARNLEPDAVFMRQQNLHKNVDQTAEKFSKHEKKYLVNVDINAS